LRRRLCLPDFALAHFDPRLSKFGSSCSLGRLAWSLLSRPPGIETGLFPALGVSPSDRIHQYEKLATTKWFEIQANNAKI
jgi:hypothetical protein